MIAGDVITSYPFGRSHAGRKPRGAAHPSENTREACVPHLEEPLTEDGVGFSSRTGAVFSAHHLHNRPDRVRVSRSALAFGAAA